MLFQFGSRSVAIINKVVVLSLVFVVVDGANGLNETETKSWSIRNKQTNKETTTTTGPIYELDRTSLVNKGLIIKVNLLSRKQQGKFRGAR